MQGIGGSTDADGQVDENMKQTFVVVNSPDEDTARGTGSALLGVPTSEVSVRPSGDSAFVVSLTNAPGQAEISVSEDKMTAFVSAITPPVGEGAPVSAGDVLQALEESGVVAGIDREAIERIVKKVADSGETERDIPVAQGRPPVDGADARLDYRFLLNGESPDVVDAARRAGTIDEDAIVKEAVAAGDILLVKTPPEAAVDGQRVTGDAVPGRPGTDRGIEVGAGVVLLDDGVTYAVADGVAGYANLVAGKLCVDDPLSVSNDAMSVTLTVQPRAASGRMLTADMVDGLLVRRGVSHGI
ncbi:MAG: DUF342 domain-containing protein, partial [Candidatus Hydrogenedentes bacterium]|nr:DUF342 domain-containing protein [Candidatus Hydrogenedentota bacterium]